MLVPWNAQWTGEARFEVRPCRWASGQLAIWSPHLPGEGRPIFAKPHPVRQRRSVAEMLCTVCGRPTPAGDRWWFALGEHRDEWFMTTEAPVHRACAELALENCPHLKRNGCAADLTPMPGGYSILESIVGGADFENEYGVKTAGRRIVGALKIAWPKERVRVVRNREAQA